jgi:hypothetical protein
MWINFERLLWARKEWRSSFLACSYNPYHPDHQGNHIASEMSFKRPIAARLILLYLMSRTLMGPGGWRRVVEIDGYRDGVEDRVRAEVRRHVSQVRPEQRGLDRQGYVEAAVIVEREYRYTLRIVMLIMLRRGFRATSARGRRRRNGRLYPLIGGEPLLYRVFEFVGGGWPLLRVLLNRIRAGHEQTTAALRVTAVIAVVADEGRRCDQGTLGSGFAGIEG